MTEIRTLVAGLSVRARWGFALGLVAILAIAGAAAWWALHPSYAPLAQNLRPADASEIGSALSQWGVPYRFDEGDKTVLVPDDQVYATRMKLAAEGIPKGGSIGFEAFKDSDYGVTEFAQQVNYQRALQGELERTIESMQEVQSARVHLTMHHAGLFERDQDPSKASVTLHLRPGQRLAARQVVGVQRLVASALEGLEPQAVTVLDQDGTVLSGAGADGTDAAALLGDRVDEASKLEKALRSQVSDLLTRALHRDDFTVSVAVQLNYDRVKRVQERLLGQGKDGNGLLVHEKTDSSRATGETAIATTSGTPASTITSRDAEYAHGNEQEEVEQAPGRIERVTVGVVIPGTLDAPDIKQLSDVVAAGIGLDPSRGDRIDIAAMSPWVPPEEHANTSTVSLPNNTVATQPLPANGSIAAPAATQAWLLPRWGYATGGTGLVLLLVIFVIARARAPVPRRLSAIEREATLERIVQWIEQPEHVS